VPLFDGGGRGRPRSDRRAFVCYRVVPVFDGGGRGRPRFDRRAFVFYGVVPVFDGGIGIGVKS